jgi:general secretion pathway protein A
MYTKFYGFKNKPFTITPDPSCLYQSPNHKKALAHLEYGLLDQVGLTLLTGNVGTGKTTIIRYIIEHYCNDLQVGVIYHTNVSPIDFFRLILSSFNIESSNFHKDRQLGCFKQFLCNQRAEGRRILIIIDEAQGLSNETLEEVRLLSNIQIDYSDVMQIMLMGQPELLNRIQTPLWDSLSQRIGVYFRLEALDLQQSCRYIAHRIERAGVTQGPFSETALELIYKHTKGIPRLINLICDAALVYGYADDLPVIDASIIETVVKERAAVGFKNELDALESRETKKQDNNNGHVEHRLQVVEN